MIESSYGLYINFENSSMGQVSDFTQEISRLLINVSEAARAPEKEESGLLGTWRPGELSWPLTSM